MASGSAARRYARAIFQIALERDSLDAWYTDLARIAEVVSAPEMRNLLRNANISRAEKKRVALDTILGISPLAVNLVQLLIDRDRLVDARRIYEEYETLLFDHRGIARARVTTAVPLDPEEQDLVTERLGELTGRRILLTAAVDPSIIGGIVARIGDKLLDGSTRTRLEELKRAMAGPARQDSSRAT